MHCRRVAAAVAALVVLSADPVALADEGDGAGNPMPPPAGGVDDPGSPCQPGEGYCDFATPPTNPWDLPLCGWNCQAAGGPAPAQPGAPAPVPGAPSAPGVPGAPGSPPAPGAPPVTAPPPPSPEEVARALLPRLVVPDPVVHASPGIDRDQLVDLPTWLWVSNWSSVAVTGTIRGVTVTVSAEPSWVQWDLGEGGVVCSTAGEAYRPGVDDPAAPSSCSYTYRSTSAGQPHAEYPASAQMVWAVTWRGPAGSSGSFGWGATETTFALRVTEAQALRQ